MVTLLLELGADPSSKNKEGKKPAEFVNGRHNAKLLKLLAENTENTLHKRKEGQNKAAASTSATTSKIPSAALAADQVQLQAAGGGGGGGGGGIGAEAEAEAGVGAGAVAAEHVADLRALVEQEQPLQQLRVMSFNIRYSILMQPRRHSVEPKALL